jgi:protein PhnA
MGHFICTGSCGTVYEEEGICMSDGCDKQYELLEFCECTDGKHGKGVITKDSNGNLLNDGDDVYLIKDLPLRGSSEVYKRGTVAKNIKLTDNPDTVECRFGKTVIVLRTEFLKKK